MSSAFSGNIFQLILHASLVVKFVLFILLIFSVVSWGIIFSKWKYFKAAKRETAYFMDIFWDKSKLSEIQRESKSLKSSPIAQLFRVGFAELKRMKQLAESSQEDPGSKLSGVSEYVERALKKTIINQGSRLDNALSFLATTGNTAPFIGLFGTVWGIMESFRGIGMKGSASLAVVAPGIAEALVATAVGLAAAIPAVVAFNYFNNKSMEFKSEMTAFSEDFMALIVRRAIKKD